jgi:acid stress-induced BolA-like protein IbaG/YrbA
MTLDEIQTRLETSIKGATVVMQGDGCNCSTLVVSSIFEGMSLLARQKMVLSAVRPEIDSGELHALSIKARTPSENSA